MAETKGLHFPCDFRKPGFMPASAVHRRGRDNMIPSNKEN